MKVSVIIPTFNRPALLRKLLETLCVQEFKDFEVIVVDDASSISYDEVIQDFSKSLSLRYIRLEQGMGAPYCRNTGISQAKGELLALVDDDDYWAPTKLQLQVELMDSKGPEVCLCYTWTQVVDESEKVLRQMNANFKGHVTDAILEECFIPSPSVMVRKAALSLIGGFDVKLPSCQDWDTWIRLALAGFEFEVVSSVQTYYLKHSGPTIGTSSKARDGYLMIYKKHFWNFLRHGKFRHLIRMVRLQFRL